VGAVPPRIDWWKQKSSKPIFVKSAPGLGRQENKKKGNIQTLEPTPREEKTHERKRSRALQKKSTSTEFTLLLNFSEKKTHTHAFPTTKYFPEEAFSPKGKNKKQDYQKELHIAIRARATIINLSKQKKKV